MTALATNGAPPTMAGASGVSLAERIAARLDAPLRGVCRAEFPLARRTWFRVGGHAEVYFEPADEADLQRFLRALPQEVSLTVLGVGSNLLVRDGGVRGAVVRLSRAFASITVAGTSVEAGAAALDLQVARAASKASLAGLEFLSGIPGTVGGALRMNAGSFGGETAEVLESARLLARSGEAQTLAVAAFEFGYRGNAVPEDVVFVSARFSARHGDPAAIAAKMEQIRAERERAQPLGAATGGSTFRNPGGKNPLGDTPEATSAWKLIEAAGCRGLRQGGAMVSEKHCNFLINTGDATAADLEALGEEVRRRVFETSGIRLEWEIRRIGDARGQGGDHA